MDQVAREPRTTQDSTPADSGAGTAVTIGPGRLLANPRRVRRA